MELSILIGFHVLAISPPHSVSLAVHNRSMQMQLAGSVRGLQGAEMSNMRDERFAVL